MCVYVLELEAYLYNVYIVLYTNVKGKGIDHDQNYYSMIMSQRYFMPNLVYIY